MQVPVRYEYCLKTSEGVGPVNRKTSMIPLSDIQCTSVRDPTFCLAATGPVWVSVYWKRNEWKSEKCPSNPQDPPYVYNSLFLCTYQQPSLVIL